MSTRGDLIQRTLAERAANPHHARREDESDAEYAARVKARLGKPRGDATAPCGHAGETVIGSYVRCLQGCDATETETRVDVYGRPLDPAAAPAPHVHVTQTATWVCQGVMQGNCACGAMRYVRNGVPGKWMEP